MNPILLRHLYSSARRNRFFWLLALYLLGIGLLTLVFSAITALSWVLETPNSISMLMLFAEGRMLYWFSSALLILTAALLVPISALGAISGEREKRTLDLLITTTLKTREITLGKMGSALLTGALYILAPFPLLMMGFWLGGVTTVELLITLLFLILTMALSIAWALFLSSLLRKTIAAVILFYGLHIATVPALFILVSTFTLLYQVWQYAETIPLQSFWVEAIIQYSWVILAGLHPITAAIITEVAGFQEGTWLILKFPVERYIGGTMHYMGDVYLLSPWITYTLFAVPATAYLLWFTTRRLSRPKR
jgi:ABC-type transport system involved in multi-copper enzyme maturation permease subunit